MEFQKFSGDWNVRRRRRRTKAKSYVPHTRLSHIYAAPLENYSNVGMRDFSLSTPTGSEQSDDCVGSAGSICIAFVSSNSKPPRCFGFPAPYETKENNFRPDIRQRVSPARLSRPPPFRFPPFFRSSAERNASDGATDLRVLVRSDYTYTHCSE